LLAAFTHASDALAAAVDAQRALTAEPWPEAATPRVRMAIHTGEAELRGPALYGGTAIIRCARLRSLAHGGQVLVSSATAEVIGARLPPDVALVELDMVRLAGFERSERVFQLQHPELTSSFGKLRGTAVDTLAPWPTALVGRAREREELAALLARARVVTILGVGGSGKTRLAHAVASETADEYPQGVAWVELARLSENAQVAGSVAAACGVSEAPGVPTLDVLARSLADARMLVVLDNCEHVLDGAASAVEALGRAGTGIHVLATTREPLGAQGEITWRIPPLGLPPEEERDAEQILRYDAARLFVERASAADSGFRLEAGTASIVCRICRRLDGLPLALELAAARVRTLSPERLADGLDDRFRLLTGGSRTGMARQRTLLASVEWSHDLLDEPERILLRRLGVFAASFTIEAAEAVAADDALDRFAVFDLLSHLVDKSLVQRSGDRYHMLETLRHFALERAADAEELAELRNRHLAWFERRARAWKLDRELARHPVLDEVALESPNLLAALEWSLDPSREMATSLLVALVPHFRRRNAYQDLRTVYRQVLGQLQEGSQAWLEALAPMASDLYFAAEVGWMPAAERSLVELGDAVSPTVRGLVSHALAIGRAFHGLPDGLRALEQAAEVGRAATNALLEGTALLALSSTLATIGERTRLHALLPWLDRHVPADAQMRFLLDHAYACVAAYDADFTTARERVASYLDGACPVPIATQAGLTGLWTSDPVLVRKAIDVAEQSFSIGAFATSMRWLHALAPLLGGDLEAAEQHLDDPAPWLMPTASTRIFLMRAEIALARDDAPRATMLLDELDPRLRGTAFHYFTAIATLLRAESLRRQGEVHEAESAAHRTLELAAAHELQVVVVDTLETLALLAAKTRNEPRAARLLGAAERFRSRTGYSWRHPYRRAPLDDLRIDLDRSHFAEGESLSLADAVELARRGRGERRRPDVGWDSLTPTEGRVVELATAGLGNREIAAKLFVSQATVKTHLIHIYDKLDVRSRAELAAAATSRRLERTSDGRAGSAEPPARQGGKER
jgi:predicted ATPase/DNA-binding CsgD family transcriptional regulator